MIRVVSMSMMAIVVMISLTACVKSPIALAGLCDDPRTKTKADGLLRPISWSTKDTFQTKAEVKEHNRVVEAVC
jgi:hypothetical protein